MTDPLQHATHYRDLLAADAEQGPYLYSKLFSDGGWLARRLSKKRFRLLQRLDPAIRPMLRPGEQVFFLTWGTAVTFLESYFLGAIMYYVNHRAIVFTTDRVLLVQITRSHRPRALRSEIRYESIRDLKGTLLGNTRLRFRNGKSRLFAGVPRQDRKLLRELFGKLSGQAEPAGGPSHAVVELCPHCYEPVTEPATRCPRCDGGFQSPRTAALLSLLFPGFGDLYTGHRVFAALEIVTAALIWLSLMVAAAEDPLAGVAGVVGLVVFVLLLVHGLDALGTWSIARKGVAPARAPVSGRLYALAALPLMAILGGFVSIAADKSRLRPEPLVLAGEEVPGRQVEALIDAGVIAPDERIAYFYSNGTVSVLEDGNFFTDRRVVSYQQLVDSLWYGAASFEEIADLHTVFAAEPGHLTELIVLLEDGRGFRLIVSPAGVMDTVFTAALADRWRASRQASPGGVWYDGGSGESEEDAVVVRGVTSAEQAAAAVVQWLTWWYGTRDDDWELAGVTQRRVDGRLINELAIMLLSQSAALRLYFDVSESSRR